MGITSKLEFWRLCHKAVVLRVSCVDHLETCQELGAGQAICSLNSFPPLRPPRPRNSDPC